MKLAHYTFREMIEFSENKINILIIEHPQLLRETTEMLKRQIDGESGEFVLSHNEEIIDFKKNAAFVTDPFNLSSDSKKVTSKILQIAFEECEKHNELITKLLSCMNELGSLLCSEIDYDITFSETDQLERIIKALELKIDDAGLSFTEKLLQYMKISRDLFGKKLFIFLNLKSFLNHNELLGFYKSIQYEKYTVLLIESMQQEMPSEFEQLKIIDNQLCEI